MTCISHAGPHAISMSLLSSPFSHTRTESPRARAAKILGAFAMAWYWIRSVLQLLTKLGSLLRCSLL